MTDTYDRLLAAQPGSHKRLIDASHRLVTTLHVLLDAGADQPPSLAFSAIPQPSALENNISPIAATAVPGDRLFGTEAPASRRRASG